MKQFWNIVSVALFSASLVLWEPSSAKACGPKIEIRFFESSDGDLFEVINASQEPWLISSLIISLYGSSGGLIFDTASGGSGASMYAPLEVVTGDVGFMGASAVEDGSETVSLQFSNFSPGKMFLFAVDVDDRLEDSDFGQAVISGPELEGARASAELQMPDGRKARAKGIFGDNAVARLGDGGLCV